MSNVKVDLKKLKKAVKEINDTDILDDKVKVVKDKDKLIDSFCTAVEEIDNLEETENLSSETIKLYDSIVEQLEEDPEEDADENGGDDEDADEDGADEEEDEVEEDEDEEDDESVDLEDLDRKGLLSFMKDQGLKFKTKGIKTPALRKKIQTALDKKAAANKKKDKKADKKKDKKADKKKKTGTPIQKAKGPGVIGSILEFIDKHGPISQDQILTRLKKRYKDRDPDKMMKTVKVQTGGKKHPIRIEREKKIKLKYDDKGKMSIAKKNHKWKTD